MRFLIGTIILLIVTILLVIYLYRHYYPSYIETKQTENRKLFMDIALKEAQHSMIEGGIPIGAVLVIDDKIIAKGYDKTIQKDNFSQHAIIDCLQNAKNFDYINNPTATLYLTLFPCEMCAGAIIFNKIKNVVVGDIIHHHGEPYDMHLKGINILVDEHKDIIDMLTEWVKNNPRRNIEQNKNKIAIS